MPVQVVTFPKALGPDVTHSPSPEFGRMPRRILESTGRSTNSHLDPNASLPGPHRKRLSLLIGELLLVAIMIVGFVILTSVIFSEQRPALERVALDEITHDVAALAFSPDGRTLACSGWDNSVRLWNLGGLKDGALDDHPIVLPQDSIRFALAFSPDGKRLACGGDHSLTLWSCGTDGHSLLTRTEGVTYRCIAFSPDGSTLAAGCDDGSVKLLDGETAEQWAVLRGHSDVVRSLAFSPDGSRLVSSGQDRQILLWDATEGKRIRSLGRSGPNPVQVVAFSPRGDQIAVGEVSGSPNAIILIDPKTGDIRSRLTGHREGVNALTFSPDGKTLASAGSDRTIKLWNLEDGKDRVTLTDGVGCVRSISFSPSGDWLAYAGSDLTIKLWHLSHDEAPPGRPLPAEGIATTGFLTAPRLALLSDHC